VLPGVSGGEKSRLALVKLLLDPPNLLLMDEPTTHLDMPSIDALVGALQHFQGTLVFISHDVYFIRAIANHVVHVKGGQLYHYPGGYQYYLDKTKALSERAALTAGQESSARKRDAADTPGASRKEQKRLEAEQRQSRSRERKLQQQRVHKLEKAIHDLEVRQTELAAELEKPETYAESGRAMQVNRELTWVTEEISKRTSQWETAATELGELETAESNGALSVRN